MKKKISRDDERMRYHIATHIIKVEGAWEGSEEELCAFVKRNIKEIDSYFSASTELIGLEERRAFVWVLISALMDGERIGALTREWIGNHLGGVEISRIEVEETRAYKDMMKGEGPNHVIWC